MQVHLLLEMAAEAAPDRVIIGSRDGGMTMGGLLDASRRAAAWMASRPGKTVTYVGLNGPSFAVAIFGASMAGRPFTPLNYRLPDASLRKLLERSAPTTTICDAELMARLSGIEGVELISAEAFAQAYTAEGEPPVLDDADEDVAIILFTSGTTSEPKAAILRHGNLTSYVLSTIEFLGADEGDAALVSVPPYHIAGISAVLTSVYSGRRMVQLPGFTPEAWAGSVAAEAVTHAMVVPTMLGRVLDVLDKTGQGLPGLRALSYGGGRMPVAVVERAMDLLPHVDFVNAYGLTETSSTISILDPQSHRDARTHADPAVRRRLSSVGRPLPSLELEIRDEAGHQVGAGVVGEVWVRGEQISGEYASGKAVRDDGWFATKDAGWLDEEGFLFVEGRLDDVIVRGGENISPSEVEDVLRRHTGVLDVAVLGLPDDEWGERIVAAVVCDPPIPTEDLRALVLANLRSSRVPEQFFFYPSLPYNDTGKLLRRDLKSQILGDPETTATTQKLALNAG
ncbi:MAG: long-chain fatty acid--CoA ligase [Caulobacter sp.]|nr:long-chain fatty acid--CoA ligase [Caulobacter sp.]